MKRVISFITLAAMICTLFAGIPVFGAGAVADNGKVVFSADFDVTNPTPILTDGNVTVVGATDGNAAQVVYNDVAYGGATYRTEEFSLTENTVLKFDIMNNGAGNNVVVGFRDKDGADLIFRLRPGNSEGNYVASGKTYTYLVYKPGGTGNAYTAYRKEVGTAVWEATTVEFKRNYSSTEAAATNNSFRFSWGSSTGGSGAWMIDNVAVYDGTPVASVIVPEDVSKTHPVYLAYEDFEGTSTIFGKKADAAPAYTLVDPENDSEDTVLDIDLSTQTTFGSHWSSYYRAASIGFPDVSLRYNISLDFRRLNDAFESEAIGIQVCPGPTTNSRVTFKIPIEYFDKGEWYNISFETYGTAAGGSSLDATTLIATKLSDGTSTTLTTQRGNTWSSSQIDAFELYPAVTSDSMLSSTLRATAHYQFDDLKISYETSDPIRTELLTSATSGNVQPLLVAYDENGVVTKVKEGTSSALETIGTYGGAAAAEYDVYASVADWQNAKSVKVLYWDGYNTAKAYTDAVEIGDAISATVGTSTVAAREFEITEDMVPEGATGKYTVLAYAVPFTVDETNIPDYDSSNYTILALEQSETAINSIKFDSSLYNGEEQDIVIVCNAEGATAPVVTLHEENDAPAFTNISMLLGADESERNFTWYSLDGSAGKLTYQKKAEMVDGAFTDGATVVDATRTHDDSVYSTKEYYYNNQAVMTGLEADEIYVYQLSNGEAKSKMYTITMADDDSTFSFAFGGDAQVGGLDGGNYADEKIHFGRTIKQMTSSPEFEGVEFFVSAGDQIESASTIKDIEAQYDIYLNHEQWATFPMAATLGNHDAKPAGTHMQHFNEPNKLINPATGTYYGASGGTGADMDGVDYYYVYNSVLFMHINLNTFDDLSNGTEAARADDKADAEEHIAFMKRVFEETADNKDILWKVVVCHQSPFGGSYHGNYTKNSNGVYNRSEQYDYINAREYLIPYFYEAGVDLVLSGHDHTYTRTHILKPNENDDILGDELNSMVISPYANTSGKNYYTYADGTTTPSYVAWTDRSGNVFDGSSDNRPYLKVSSKPVKVTDPDGFLWVTGSSSSGSQVNGAENPNHYAAVCEKISQRSLSRIDITPTSLKLVTYNLGTNTANNDPMVVVDEFEIEKTSAVAVQGVSVEETAEIAVGQTKALNAKLSPAEPTNKNVTWTSDNEAVAKVDENGVVTAISAGTANITVTTEDGEFTATCVITVVDAVPVTAITLPETATMEVYATKTISAAITPENATTKTLKWSSSDESIATVDANGNVTAHKHGEVTITAAATDGSGVTASCVITVTYTPSTRTLNKTEVTLAVLETDKLSLTITPSNATYQDVTWVSSDSNVVEVNASGELKAISQGTATVSAVTAEGSVDCAVTVTGKVTFEQTYEDESNTAMMPSSTNAVYKRIQDTDGNWVLQVDGSGLTTSTKVGSVYTTQLQSVSEREVPTPNSKGDVVVDFDVKNMSSTGHQSINIRLYTEDQVHYAQKIRFNTFDLGEWYDVRYVRKSNGNVIGYYKKWSDAEWTEVTVTGAKEGAVFAAGSGISSQIHYGYMAFCPYDTITDSVDSASGTNFYIDNMRVYSPVATEGMTLAENSANLEVGETAVISPVFTPSNATDGHAAYSTSDANVATVDRYGKVTAIGAGTAEITVTAADGGYTAIYAVTVKAVVPEITVVKDGNQFTVTTNVTVDGETVYIAAYDANDRVLNVVSGDYAAAGTVLTLAAEGASYYKAFIWDADAVPAISEKLFN